MFSERIANRKIFPGEMIPTDQSSTHQYKIKVKWLPNEILSLWHLSNILSDS